MALKLLSNVPSGEIIKHAGSKFKVTKNSFGIFLTKELMPGIFGGNPADAANVFLNYRGAANTFVEVVEVGNAPKSDLTSQLRQQQKKQSLIDSLREQQAVTKEDEAPKSLHLHGYSHVSQLDGVIPAVEEAKKSALSANLRAQSAGNIAQQAQQVGQQARLDASLAKSSAASAKSSVESLGYEIGGLDDRISDIAYEVERNADIAFDAQEAAYEAIHRVSAIEAKQLEEEKKMSLQNELNRKLAEKARQNDLQAQLNQKLNQKTTGGNGTMKKLFGAAFNFGKVEGKFAFSPITGGLALRKGLTNDFVAYNKDTKELTDVSGLTLKFDVPAFKLPVAGTAVEVGDLIIHNAEYVYVTKKADGYLETLNPEKGVRGSVVPTKNALLGAAFYTVVKTLDAAGQGGFNPMLLMAMSKGSDKSELLPLLLATGGLGGQAQAGGIDPTMLMLLGDDVEDLLPLVLMQQGGATGAGFNPLMFLAMNKGGKSKDLLPMLLATGGLNAGQAGAGQINPMMMMALAGDGDLDLTTLALMGGLGQGGLFGQAPAAASAKEVKKDK
jgi:hypothetical protein